jgi:hypothetical protein
VGFPGAVAACTRDCDSCAEKAVADLDDEIDRLRNKTSTANKKNAKKYNARIGELEAERNRIFESITGRDSPDMARVRSDVMRHDERLRDLAPAVTRAYARAQGKWDVYEGQRAQIAKMLREGQTTLPDVPATVLPDEMPNVPALTITDRVAEMRRPVPVDPEGRPKVYDQPADQVQAVMDEDIKAMNDAVADFQTTAARLVKAADPKKERVEGEPDPLMFKVDGVKHEMHIDQERIVIGMDAEGKDVTVSIRELLEDVANDDAILKAVGTCSIGKTS